MATTRRELLVSLMPLALAACETGTSGSAERRGSAHSPEQPPPEHTPDPPPHPEPDRAVSAGDPLTEHVADLRRELQPRGWHVLAEPPFAIVGDGTRAQVERHASGTVRWAVDHLRRAYFERDPDELVTIWLFETSKSYERHALELFGEPPDTPYGYYSPSHHALVMNIGTGGGTLVHEIVHPFMRANFPSCPSWFDEGLASLYEQSAEREGEIVGLTNWRLAGLQEALAGNTVPSFRELCESGEGFYTADPGTNYAQARYLCYWLQEQGLLRSYYRRFRAAAAEDPSGYATLVELVGPEMPKFRARWERFVMAATFP
jgi:hypothetical protein